MNKNIKNKIIDIIFIFALTGIGISLALNLLPYIKNLSGLIKIIAMSTAQFSIAGLGVVIVMLWRKERFCNYGIKKENALKSLLLGALFICVYLAAIYIKKGTLNWMPFKQVDVTKLALTLKFPLNILGLFFIVLSYGFFEGFNLVYISEKINSLSNISNPFLKLGPLVIVICNTLVHMGMGQNFLNAASGSIAVYAVTIIPALTGNSLGSILIFMLLWNAI